MNVTFMIGNGFDLNLGLKTRYTDFYPYYKEKHPDDMIAKQIPDDYANWSDLELGLGNMLESITEEDKDAFLDSKYILEVCLAEYLKIQSENAEFEDFDKAKETMRNNLSAFFSDFETAEQKIVAEKLSKEEVFLIQMSFITFNYTDLFDRLIGNLNNTQEYSSLFERTMRGYSVRFNSALHIHGTLENGMVLGVNDSSQIKNKQFQNDDEFCGLFIKPDVLSEIDEERIRNAKAMIDNSDYVCLFGLSVGDTDAYWWTYLMKWLEENDSRRLVLYVRSDENINVSTTEIIRNRKKNRRHIIRHKDFEKETTKEFTNRIIIINNSKIFDLPIQLTVQSRKEKKNRIMANDNKLKIDEVWPEWSAVGEPIGRGSYGVVYKCVCREGEVERYSAIKVISVPQGDINYSSLSAEKLENIKAEYKEIVNSFSNEIKIHETLKGNKNIVAIEDSKIVEREDGIGWHIFIRMELLTDLEEYMENHPFEKKDVLKLGIDLCQALKDCGEKKIIHRDIKPNNIFVDSEGNFKLGDFSVAKQLEKMMVAMSRKGTYEYMSPELFYSQKCDSRADVYSLAIVLYRLFNNNRLPFLNTEKNIITYSEREAAFNRRINGEKIPPINNVDESINITLLRALEYKKEDRFKNVEEFETALRRCAQGKRTRGKK